jgi:hypothetical protein
MEFFAEEQFRTLSNPGGEFAPVALAAQLEVRAHHDYPRHGASGRITAAARPPSVGANLRCLERLGHALLLANSTTRTFSAGEVARFADGDVHGFENSTTGPFVYMSMTPPPIDFAYAYREAR